MGIRIVTTDQPKDRDAMIALRSLSFKEHYGDNPSIAHFKNNGQSITNLLDDPDNLHFKAVDETNEIQGFIIYSMSEDKEGKIARLLQISTAKKKQGIGTKLMKHFQDDARLYGFKKIVAEPLPIAEDFYRKQGFVQHHPVGDYVLNLYPNL